MSGGRGSPRRLVIAVVLVAAAVAAALATVVFVLVRDARLQDSLDRARAEVEFDMRLAGPLLEGSTEQQAVETFQEERGVHAILITDDQTFDSEPALGVTIPPALA